MDLLAVMERMVGALASESADDVIRRVNASCGQSINQHAEAIVNLAVAVWLARTADGEAGKTFVDYLQTNIPNIKAGDREEYVQAVYTVSNRYKSELTLRAHLRQCLIEYTATNRGAGDDDSDG